MVSSTGICNFIRLSQHLIKEWVMKQSTRTLLMLGLFWAVKIPEDNIDT